MSRLLLALAGMLLVLPMNGVAFAQPPTERDGVLRIAEEANEEIAGEFASGGSYVSFRSHKVSGVAKVTVEVNGKDVHAQYDDAAGMVSFDGHDMSLFDSDREALRSLSNELVVWFQGGEVAPGEFLLQRLVLYLSDAPLGLPIPARTIYLVQGQHEDEDAPPAVIAGSALDPEVIQPASRPSVVTEDCTVELTASGVSSAAAAAACQVADDDRVSYMSCARITRTLWHDATSHCFQSEQVDSGKGSPDCLGRCGAGCGSISIRSVYTYDCGEHDRCCRVHGGCTDPYNASCGDEFFDADDDFFAGTNCWGG